MRPRTLSFCGGSLSSLTFSSTNHGVEDIQHERVVKDNPSSLSRAALAAYAASIRFRSYLSKKRLRWQRSAFYNSLDLVPQVHFYHTVSPFLRTVELDACIYAYKGDLEKLKQCLERRVSPNLRCLLEIAIYGDKVPVLRLLLDAGANPNRTIDWGGTTLLHEAVQHGNPEMVELLLARGADPNLEDRMGRKPLVNAWDRSEGRSPLAKLLNPLTKFPPPNYNVDDFLKMEDPKKAYWALYGAIRSDFRDRTPAELTVISMHFFINDCLTNGIDTFETHARWALIPAAELLDAIDEPELAGPLWEAIAIMRQYGEKVGHDFFDPDADYMALDKETENKLRTFDSVFFEYTDPAVDERLYRKTMDYVRKNRELFTHNNKL